MVAVPPGARGKHRLPLPAGQVVEVAFEGSVNRIEVVFDGTSVIWWTYDGTTPTVGGDRCFYIPAGVIGTDSRSTGARYADRATTVKLLAETDTSVSVMRD